jgi:hypothetical protein
MDGGDVDDKIGWDEVEESYLVEGFGVGSETEDDDGDAPAGARRDWPAVDRFAQKQKSASRQQGLGTPFPIRSRRFRVASTPRDSLLLQHYCR